MDRIAQAFARARSENRACFVATFVRAIPIFETSLEACRSLLPMASTFWVGRAVFRSARRRAYQSTRRTNARWKRHDERVF